MQPVVIGDVMWEPSPEVISKSRLKRFMEQHGIETFAELLKRADDDIEWFWDAAIKDIDIAFYRHYDKVVDLSNGKAWATWCMRAQTNGIDNGRPLRTKLSRLRPLMSCVPTATSALDPAAI